MSMMAETYMLQAIQKGLASIKSSPDQLADILTALNASEMSAAQKWFAQNPVTVAPGFPNAQTKLPFVGVTIATEDPATGQTGIGLAYYTVTDNTTGQTSEMRGARFVGTLKGTIYSPNADLIVWLSAVCKWSLLTNYDWLATEAGLNDIRIGLGDYEPSPGFLPVFTFARGVYLSAEYDQVFSTPVSPITSTEVNGTFNAIGIDGEIQT